jgi:hypothetical protein
MALGIAGRDRGESAGTKAQAFVPAISEMGNYCGWQVLSNNKKTKPTLKIIFRQ